MSGGNQQKLVVARELSRHGLAVLICAQPTRGVDVGAIEAIHRRMIEARDRGLAVLLLSAELSELRSLSDRLAVLYKGQIVATLDHYQLAADGALDTVGAMMTGAWPQRAGAGTAGADGIDGARDVPR
jgi:simple sugar transport system ATP-binding protein